MDKVEFLRFFFLSFFFRLQFDRVGFSFSVSLNRCAICFC